MIMFYKAVSQNCHDVLMNVIKHTLDRFQGGKILF